MQPNSFGYTWCGFSTQFPFRLPINLFIVLAFILALSLALRIVIVLVAQLNLFVDNSKGNELI